METKKGTLYLIAGGDWHMKQSFRHIITEIRKQLGRAPRVAYLGVANDDNAPFYLMIKGMLRSAGAGAVTLAPLAAARRNPEKAQRVLSECDLVHINGGDIDLGMQCLEQCGLIEDLRQRFESGLPFSGLSAGTMMLSRSWVRWPDPDNDATAELFPCLGFTPILCDTHEEKEDWAEFRTHLRLEAPGQTAYGMCSGSAMTVHPDGRLEVTQGKVYTFCQEGEIFRQTGKLSAGK